MAHNVDTLTISVVKTPAIGYPSFRSVDHKFVGPILIPDLDIYRVEASTGYEFYISFPQDEVVDTAFGFCGDNRFSLIDTEHDGNIVKAHLSTTWIEGEGEIKASDYGFSMIPYGTWMGVVEFDSDEDWNRAQALCLNGFSIQCDIKELELVE